MVVAEADVLHRAEWQKCLLHSVLVNVKVYAADIDPMNKHLHNVNRYQYNNKETFYSSRYGQLYYAVLKTAEGRKSKKKSDEVDWPHCAEICFVSG